jgi:two-component system, chemotaxis family, protein-glutamate methylesterase/glutaminase
VPLRAESESDVHVSGAGVIIVVAASAGGVQALSAFVGGLPPDLDAAVFVVLHSSAQSPRLLADILSRKGPLPARYAVDLAPIASGEIRIAEPDYHLLLEADVMRVVRGPKENLSRPSADPLFRSAAWAFGPCVIGIVMSGMLSDGTAGLWAIKSCGGTTIVQDPDEAAYVGMPNSALQSVPVDFRLPADEIGRRVGQLVAGHGEVDTPWIKERTMDIESKFAKMEADATDNAVMDRIGRLSPLTCPTCQGSLWQVNDQYMLRYRCHTGHAFTADILHQEHGQRIEDALYIALAALEEKVHLSTVLEKQFEGRGETVIANDFRMKAERARASADDIRALVSAPASRDTVHS